jgi:hypothetical protein
MAFYLFNNSFIHIYRLISLLDIVMAFRLFRVKILKLTSHLYVFVAIIEYKGGSATRIHTCPLLFPIFINDIVDEIQCNIRLFADNTSLHSVVEDAYEDD